MIDYENHNDYYTAEQLPENTEARAPYQMICEECGKGVNIPSIQPEMVTKCCGCSYQGVYKKEWFGE
jgi:DNA-directed RNA polymerase subunit RPC12/RpoP